MSGNPPPNIYLMFWSGDGGVYNCGGFIIARGENLEGGFINPKLQKTLERKSPFIALWLCSQRNHIENAVRAWGEFSVEGLINPKLWLTFYYAIEKLCLFHSPKTGPSSLPTLKTLEPIVCFWPFLIWSSVLVVVVPTIIDLVVGTRLPAQAWRRQ